MKILVKRQGALGDVLCITPVLARLRKEFPSATIAVETGHPQALSNNPHIDHGVNLSGDPDAWVISLDLAYERQPKKHIVCAYLDEAFNNWEGDKTLVYRFNAHWASEQGAIIHAAASWPSRSFTREFWDDVARKLVKRGLQPVFVGSGGDYHGPDFATHAVGRLTLDQVAALTAKAKVFIGSDSALLHFAGCTDTPIVGLYTCARAKYRMPWRNGVLGSNMIGLEPALDCIGCLERMPVPSTNVSCERGDNICSRSIQPDAVVRAAEQLLDCK